MISKYTKAVILLSQFTILLLYDSQTLTCLSMQIIKHRWSAWDVTSLGVYFCLGSKRGCSQLSPAIQHAQFICKQIQQSDSVSSLIICVLLSVPVNICSWIFFPNLRFESTLDTKISFIYLDFKCSQFCTFFFKEC